MIQKRGFKNPLTYAYRLLAIRPRSYFEIRQKLKSKNFSSEEIEDVIKTLKSQKLLDDKKFAAEWLNDKIQIRPIGKRLIFQKLKLLGIEEETISQVINEFLPPQKEIELARQILAKKKKKLGIEGQIMSYNIRQKLMMYLASKGFEREIINEVMNNY